MRRFAVVSAVALVTASAVVWFAPQKPRTEAQKFYAEISHYLRTKGKVPKVKEQPNDWFYRQRAWPNRDIPMEARLKATDQARAMVEAAKAKSAQSVVWSQAGPSNIPGRITDLAVHPSQPNTIYAASAAGGVFKSTDLGANWTPIFDATGTQSVGAIAIHPTNPNILYVGTGEANGANDTYEGTGVYKSIDAGVTWINVGLPNSYHIGRVLIDPLRPETVYVAVAGKLFGSTNPERGLYRTRNGGGSWELLLHITDSTACIDVAMHPSSGTIFAAMWERWRDPRERRVGGMSSGIWRSENFGANWILLNQPGFGLPLPAPNVGRIGVTVDPQSTVVYAIFHDHPGNFLGVYRSIDLGDTWTRTNDFDLNGFDGGFGWYFGQIRTVPGNFATVYALGVGMYKSEDAGDSWASADFFTHSDNHALFILPTNPSRLYDGGDGGVNYSTNGGTSWSTFVGMPNTQFYAITIDPRRPYSLYGGTQDNGTLRTAMGSVDSWDWIHGGDGFYAVVDHADSNVIYAEYQWGWMDKSTDFGSLFDFAMNGIDYDNERHNWNTPFVMDPSNHNTLYYGSNRLYKTTDAAANWTRISGDLTDGDDPGNLTFGTITTIAAAKSNGQVVYVGTDDANVWVTTNGGGNWQQINAGLPNRWVTRVAVDPRDAGIAYVTFSGYKDGLQNSHIYRTINYGGSWTDIHGNLFDAPVNDVIIDPADDSTLYIGSDFGVYQTTNRGQSWAPLGVGTEIFTVYDLDFHPASRTLVAGTHGRSMFKTTLPCPPGYPDTDSDLITDNCDNCPTTPNPLQEDTDRDGIGDACECICACHADPQCDGIISDVLDVTATVAVAFRGAPPLVDPDCPRQRTDVNCTGDTDVLDVVSVVDVSFRAANPIARYCDACL